MSLAATTLTPPSQMKKTPSSTSNAKKATDVSAKADRASVLQSGGDPIFKVRARILPASGQRQSAAPLRTALLIYDSGASGREVG